MKTHGPLQVAVFVEPMFQENTFLLWPTQSEPNRPTPAWVVDPGFAPQAEDVLAEVKARQLALAAALVTHGHVDHIAGLEELQRELPALAIAAPHDEADMLTDPSGNLSAHMGMPIVAPAATRVVTPGDVLRLGALEFTALDVSGHSPGGTAYYCAAAGVVFVGDALFAGSIGRTDFPGSSLRTLCRNIRNHLFSLPAQTVVYSGHGPATTIAEERASNPFLRGEGTEL